jgi:hypothetical protein
LLLTIFLNWRDCCDANNWLFCIFGWIFLIKWPSRMLKFFWLMYTADKRRSFKFVCISNACRRVAWTAAVNVPKTKKKRERNVFIYNQLIRSSQHAPTKLEHILSML